MDDNEMEEYRKGLEARMLEFLEENPDCIWIMEALNVYDGDTTEEADVNELDEFFSSLV